MPERAVRDAGVRTYTLTCTCFSFSRAGDLPQVLLARRPAILACKSHYARQWISTRIIISIVDTGATCWLTVTIIILEIFVVSSTDVGLADRVCARDFAVYVLACASTVSKANISA